MKWALNKYACFINWQMNWDYIFIILYNINNHFLEAQIGPIFNKPWYRVFKNMVSIDVKPNLCVDSDTYIMTFGAHPYSLPGPQKA